ncbi:hypothetical protein Slin15195_G038010 [Septoria linicola]|uniref:Vacuolar ATPase assembly protein VMA22 n=1 Tax=Septoria linicola TaxID=215465 RepID=A0A9Q9AJG9_9PEZI|nr:hypothetical protein Slin14017_G119410 [Septoria linicola]USW50482.1 hypothetical protein Slin15195_G038010 [Septoria linicola]
MAEKKTMDEASREGAENLVLLYSQLDELWIRYLQLLDEYTNAQTAIKKHMSAGFFSLAQANFKSTRGRYGQDYYDERAVASTRVAIDAQDDSYAFEIRKSGPDVDEQPVRGREEDANHDSEDSKGASQSEKPNIKSEKDTSADQLPTPEATPEPESKRESTDTNEASSTASKTESTVETSNSERPTDEEETPKVNLQDPIRWFGILVPPTLRQAQASFSKALLDETAMTKAVNTSRGLREAEVEIRKLRKSIKKAEKAVYATDALPIRRPVEASS